MNHFILTVRTLTSTLVYDAIGQRDALMDAAYDLGGVCGVSIKAAA